MPVEKLIEISLWICFFAAMLSGTLLAKTTKKIINTIQLQIRRPEIACQEEPNLFLKRIEEKYVSLLCKVDNVNTNILSSGEICDLRVYSIRAEKLQYFINQAPSLLISIGLLGTFAGLTSGLGEIQDVLQPNISAQDATLGLGKIITPMSLAFKTSLMGLTLSLSLIVIYQITGWKNILDRLNDLLSNWLETVLPIKLGQKISTPLRAAIDNLNQTIEALPVNTEKAVYKSMSESFSSKLDEFFNIYAELSTETTRIINSLSTLAGAFRDSSSDYFEASKTFDQCTFADELKNCISGLNEAKVDMLQSSNNLCEKILTMKDELVGINSSWNVLTVLSSEQLQCAKDLVSTNSSQEISINKLLESANSNTLELSKAAKELRNTRLEVGRDRKAMQDSVIAIEARLDSSAKLDISHSKLITTYQKAVEDWQASIHKNNKMHEGIVNNLRKESDAIYAQTHAMSNNYKDELFASKNVLIDLVEKLNSHSMHIEKLSADMKNSCHQQREDYSNLVDKTIELNNSFDELKNQKNNDTSSWNQPWRFGK